MDAPEPSKCVSFVRMVREADPYAIPVTSIGRDNRLAAGYANRSLFTRLTPRARPRISDAETDDSSSDTMKIIGAVSDMDSFTEPHRSSVRLDADRSNDANARGLPMAPSDEGPVDPDPGLLRERATTFPPPISRPPETPAGRLVLSRLPGRIPPSPSSARTAAKDQTPPRGEASMFFRVCARLGWRWAA